jgi:isopentenyl diphosphate isomerase/L-lactate dehydrogenase-like FMN-dependent dehydrogenase
VGKAAGSALQLYADGDEKWVSTRPKHAAGRGDCLTVDVDVRPQAAPHRRAVMAGRPFGALRTGEANRARADWTLVDKLKRAVKLPLMLKGIQTAEDADLAVKHGVDVIYVSNHGGRQLDHGRGAIDLLPEVVSAARGKAEFVVDGGFLRGTDI